MKQWRLLLISELPIGKVVMRNSTVVVAIVILSLSLYSLAPALVESCRDSEWQILTKGNFSSEIRLHPHILLLVTIPWSGEARSLMKQLGNLVIDQPKKYGHLRLMVVYKNFEKMLASVLGATDDIVLYYYHHSTSYKYNGRFAAEKIFSSVNYFMSLKSEEVPLKPLHTKKELDFFLESTDTAVILIELCGWSSKLLHKETCKKTSSVPLIFSKEDTFKATLFADESLSFDVNKKRKGLENEGFSCGVENGLTDSHLSGEFYWANSSTLEEIEYEAVDINLSCTKEDFKQFRTFFSKFKLLATEYILPPERIRFGLISERDLLPYVGVNTMGAWSVTLQFNGCPSCSLIIEAIDDLRKILQERHSPVMQLDVDGHNLVPTFPANRPSVVLFIDRLSDSPVIREKSKLSLTSFRKLAEHFQPSYKMHRQTHYGNSQSPTAQVASESWGIVSDSSSRNFLKDSLLPRQVKKDTMTIVINKGQRLLADQTVSDAQGNAIYDALLDFINKRDLARKEQTKLSFLAKQIGFQLLSDDFEIQIEDSSHYRKHNQLSDMNTHKVMGTGDQTYKLHQQPSKDSVNKNDDLHAVIEEPAVDDQAALDAEDDHQKYLEIATKGNSNTNEDDNSEQNENGSLLCHDGNSLLELHAPSVGTCTEKDTINDAIGSSLSSKEAAEKLSFVLREDFAVARDDEVQVVNVLNMGDQTLKLHAQPSEDFSNQKVNRVMTIGDQPFNLNQHPSEDSVNQNNDIQKYLKMATMENNNIDGDYKICEQNDIVSLNCHSENSLLERGGPSVGTCMETYNVDAVGCSSSYKEAADENFGHSDDFTEDDRSQVEENMMTKPNEEHSERQYFHCSFFFIDGGYRLLNSLTGGSNIPSLVLLDPVEQHHYVFNEDREIDYSSLINFVEKFLNGSLSPYQPSEPYIVSTKKPPRPPFVNLDFHEVDAIPRLTTNTFCELVFGFKPCITENVFSISEVQHLGAAWKQDVLVLFSSSWCGFCQRMELLVREVFQAFKLLKDMLKCGSNFTNLTCVQDKNGDMLEYTFPSVFLMECTQNDCGSYLKSAGRNEYYPELLLYLAQNKSAVPFEGDMLVVNIIKFIVSKGQNSQFLNKYKGYLWKHSSDNNKQKLTLDDSSPLLISSTKPQNIVSDNKGEHYIVPGSVLSATDKLREVVPFHNSTILITIVNEGEEVQGIIVNKPISWNVFDSLDNNIKLLRQAPLFYGGPVAAEGLPLVSLARKATEGYMKVIPGFYYGNPVITRMIIEGINSGDRSLHDYLFFLGYCNWKWDQIFDELASGAWHLNAGSNQILHWLKS